jgi:hypothetical protein
VGLGLACLLGASLIVMMHRSDWVRPVLSWLAGPPTPAEQYPLRKFDPTCRLRGWRTLAAEVDRLRAELRARGEEPVLAATNWSLPGELGLYCEGQPTVYSIGMVQDDRHSQYDLWPGPANDPDSFRGQTFLIVGAVREPLRNCFEQVEETRLVRHLEGEDAIALWGVTVCHGFKGSFPRRPEENVPH